MPYRFGDLIWVPDTFELYEIKGPAIESIVSRTICRTEQTGDPVRLEGLSATLPNHHDVASFLRVEEKGLFHFDATFRGQLALDQHCNDLESRACSNRCDVVVEISCRMNTHRPLTRESLKTLVDLSTLDRFRPSIKEVQIILVTFPQQSEELIDNNLRTDAEYEKIREFEQQCIDMNYQPESAISVHSATT